jgi:glucose/arabinose dehydrogenase
VRAFWLALVGFAANVVADAPLRHHELRPQDLPAPFITPAAENPPHVIARPHGATLQVPPGFSIRELAEGLSGPRWLALAPTGEVLLAESNAGRIRVLPANGGGESRVLVSGLELPFGMAIHGAELYVATTGAVLRYPLRTDPLRIAGPARTIATLPGHGYRQHWTRNLLFSLDGHKLYVTVGSESNVSIERDPRRAAILELNPDGSGQRIFASGLRNPVGLGWNPKTGALWAAVEERDLLGDDLPPDYVTEVKDGGFYGWPFAYIGPHPDPNHPHARPDLFARTTTPDVLVQAHSAVLGLAFYQGTQFPAEYRGDAFVACHGSWNRSQRTGYKIVRIRFREGRPVGGYDDFVTGWMLDPKSRDVWGRPVGLLVAKDGSLLIADDGADKIWRVQYDGPAR